MGAMLQLVGFAALAVWAAFVFGWPAALLVAGLEFLIIGTAAGDVKFSPIAWYMRRSERG